MWLSQATFVGVAVANAQRLVYAALDEAQRLLALSQGDLAEVTAFCGGQQRAAVAIGAPATPSKGLLQQAHYRQTLPHALRPGRWQEGRVAEYLLRRHNLRMLPTPADPRRAPAWVQTAFRLVHRLQQGGYAAYPATDAPLLWLETYPYAGFAALLGHLPWGRRSLEGRIQRQLVLREQGLDLPDPLRIFEEFTRHRFLQGVLPTEGLFTPPELDALLAAWTAYRAATAPDEVTALGEPEEGVIVLPVPALKPRYAGGAG